MQCSFSDDPTLSERLFGLLETVFPGVRQAALNVRRLGASWESVSTPFLLFEDGQPVSHIGVIGLSLVLLGRIVTVGSVHAVATHPDYRRRGCYRRLMEEVLEYGTDHYGTLILTTGNPEYYEPFGFRVLREHLFTLGSHSPGGVDGLRLMNMQDAGDVALLNRLLERREPVSQVVGVINEKAIFCFNEGSRPLYYAEDLDTMVCMEMEGTTLKLFDVVAAELPSFDALLAMMPRRVDEVAVHFSMDRFTTEAVATPYVLDHGGPSYLMGRGPFAAEGEAFTLPRSARA